MKKLFLIFICCFSSLFAFEGNQIILDGSTLNRVLNPFSVLEKKSDVTISHISKEIIIPVETDLSDRAAYYSVVPNNFIINNSELENILTIFLNDKRTLSYKSISLELISAKINILFNEFEDERLYALSDVILDLEVKIIKDGVSTILKSSMNKKFGNDSVDYKLTVSTDDFKILKVNEAIQKEFEYSLFLLLKKIN